MTAPESRSSRGRLAALWALIIGAVLVLWRAAARSRALDSGQAVDEPAPERRATDPPPGTAADPAHAPGHRHRHPPAEEEALRPADPEPEHDQPWIRGTFSDSQQRRSRGHRY